MRRTTHTPSERPNQRPLTSELEHLLDPELWCLLCIGALLVLAH